MSKKKVTKAIKKAQGIGQIEDSFQLHGVNVVLRTLTTPEVSSAQAETEADGLTDTEILSVYKISRLAYAIVEVGEESFRDVDLVQFEEESEDGKSTIRTLEKNVFVRDYILTTWSQEAIDVAFRKFLDLIKKSEDVSAKGIVFDTSDEGYDDKYRRLLLEAKSLEELIPVELADKIRDEIGYTTKFSLGGSSEPQIAPPRSTPIPMPEPPKPSAQPITHQPEFASEEALDPFKPVTPPPGEVVVGTRQAPVDDFILEEEPRRPQSVPLAQLDLDAPPKGGLNPRFRAPAGRIR